MSTILDLACKSWTSELFAWCCVVKEAMLTYSSSIQQPPTLSHKPHCFVCSLTLFFPPPLPFPALNPHPFPHLSSRLPSCILKWRLCAHPPHLWGYSLATPSSFFDTLSFSVRLYLYISLCVFALLKDSRLHKRNGIKGIREEENQPIVKGWHDGHYHCMLANYNLFFSICVGAVDRFHSVSEVLPL